MKRGRVDYNNSRMGMSVQTAMAIKSYQSQAQLLLNNYLIAETCIPYTSLLSGLLACKVAYDLTQLISTFYFKTYNGLTKIQRLEWNNRGLSTIHAVYVTAMSLYFVFWSDIFSDRHSSSLITSRSSSLSTFGLGIVHHSLSVIAVAYSIFSREGQLYTYMVLISEVTTPEINMRWYLDTAGMKRSYAYLINGVTIFFAWLIARILLFVYMFYHVYLHYDQVMRMHVIGYLLVFVVPSVLAVMNLIWFGKIVKGLKKTLAKRQ